MINFKDFIEKITYSIVSPRATPTQRDLTWIKSSLRIWTQRPIIRPDNKNEAFMSQTGYVNEYDNIKFNINGAEIVESRW